MQGWQLKSYFYDHLLPVAIVLKPLKDCIYRPVNTQGKFNITYGHWHCQIHDAYTPKAKVFEI